MVAGLQRFHPTVHLWVMAPPQPLHTVVSIEVVERCTKEQPGPDHGSSLSSSPGARAADRLRGCRFTSSRQGAPGKARWQGERHPASALPDPGRGVLGSRWSDWFEGLRITSDAAGESSISGVIADQAALHGLLAKVRDLGLVLVEVRRINPDRS
jgi:hypothetical protein